MIFLLNLMERVSSLLANALTIIVMAKFPRTVSEVFRKAFDAVSKCRVAELDRRFLGGVRVRVGILICPELEVGVGSYKI